MFSPYCIEKHLHISETCHSQLLSLLYPLFSQTPIKYFAYNRFYPGQRWIGLYSNPLPVRKTLEEGIGPFFLDEEGISMPSGHFFHEDLKDQFKESVSTGDVDRFFEQKKNPQVTKVVTNGLLILRKRKKYHECFYFSLFEKNPIKQSRIYYEQSMESIKNFCHYFLYKGNKLISMCEENKIAYHLPRPEIKKETKKLFSCQPSKHLSFQESKLKFCFTTEMGDVFLSQQELNCLRLLCEGHSSVQIASRLNLKYSTIVTYLKNIKFKLNAQSKDELIAHYREFSTLD